MIAHLLGVGDQPIETLDLSPQHGEDYCEGCLACFAEDSTSAASDGKPHSWVVYPDQVAVFKARFGLAGEDTP
jgi:hypothetical protein